jgi:hypothetical protein
MGSTLNDLSKENDRADTQGGPLERFARGPASSCTVVAVDLELGANNAVFIRGKGCGLRWDRGQPLTCLGPRRWVWSAGPSEERVEFGLLLDDQVWARGEKMVLDPGRSIEITPDFEWPEIPKVATDSKEF